MENLQKLIKYNILISAVVAIIGIVLFNLGIKHRASSFISGYTTYSMYLLPAFVFGTFHSKLFQKHFEIYIWQLAVSVIATGIFLAMGRIDILIIVLIFIAAVIVKKISIKSALIICAFSAVIILLSLNNNSAEAESRASDLSTMSDRDIIWAKALEIIDVHPILGYGPRTFGDIFTEQEKLADKQVGGWHSEYITIYIESGILGLLTFLVITFLIYFYAYKAIWIKKLIGNELEMFIPSLLSITVIYISSTFSGFSTQPIISVYFCFIFGIYSNVVFKAGR
ncbi:MAG: O-antigen ligase family protein [bacterium]